MMKLLILTLLAAGSLLLNACSLPELHLPKFKHDGNAFLDHQKELLKADDFNISTSTSSFKGKSVSYLTIKIVNAQAMPNPADSSAAAVKRLARRVVAELSNPSDYQSVQVAVEQRHSVVIASATQQQSFSYSMAALR